jgi:hypothetical protein
MLWEEGAEPDQPGKDGLEGRRNFRGLYWSLALDDELIRAVRAMSTLSTNNLERALRENLDLRRQRMSEVAKAEEPASLGQKMGKWWKFGRDEDQPLIFALLLVVVAIALYLFVTL